MSFLQTIRSTARMDNSQRVMWWGTSVSEYVPRKTDSSALRACIVFLDCWRIRDDRRSSTKDITKPLYPSDSYVSHQIVLTDHQTEYSYPWNGPVSWCFLFLRLSTSSPVELIDTYRSHNLEWNTRMFGTVGVWCYLGAWGRPVRVSVSHSARNLDNLIDSDFDVKTLFWVSRKPKILIQGNTAVGN